jgi:hypothetical protein
VPDQPSLFDGAEQAARSGASSRAEFLAGMLAVWLLGDRKPSKAQREELMKLSRRFVSDCELVVNVHLTSP